MSLADASDARKARLLALRKRKAGEDIPVDENDSSQAVIHHRTFDPETRTLRKHARTHDEQVDSVEKRVEGLAEKIVAEDAERRAQELDLFNIAPKRPNWDLKREMEKKLAKLERKTQEAIHSLLRQRLAAQKGQSDDLVGAMKADEKAGLTEDPASDEDD